MAVLSLEGVAPEVPAGGLWWAAPDATLVGRVFVSEGVGVWFGAVLRGDNEPIRVGRDTNIQEHAVLHTDPGYPLTIGEGCTIGHRAIVHGCTIGSNTLIGMGAIVLNGARIGNDCLVGAGALVPEGREIPDGSLVVGVPGKVVRALDAAAIEGLRRSATAYVSNWRRFSAALGR